MLRQFKLEATKRDLFNPDTSDEELLKIRDEVQLTDKNGMLIPGKQVKDIHDNDYIVIKVSKNYDDVEKYDDYGLGSLEDVYEDEVNDDLYYVAAKSGDHSSVFFTSFGSEILGE